MPTIYDPYALQVYGYYDTATPTHAMITLYALAVLGHSAPPPPLMIRWSVLMVVQPSTSQGNSIASIIQFRTKDL